MGRFFWRALEMAEAVVAAADARAAMAPGGALAAAPSRSFCSIQPASPLFIIACRPATVGTVEVAGSAAREVRGATAHSVETLTIYFAQTAPAETAETAEAAATAGTAAAARAVIPTEYTSIILTPARRYPAPIRSPSASPARAEAPREMRDILASLSNSERPAPVASGSKDLQIFNAH